MAGAHWTPPPNMETGAPPTGETCATPEHGNQQTPEHGNREPPTVRTGGGLDEPRRPAPPTVRTGGGLSAAAWTSRGSRGGFDLAKLLRAILRQNPSPVIPSAQALPVRMPPNDARGGLGARWIDSEPPSRCGCPVAQFREIFDDHAGILPGRGNRRKARPWQPEFSQYQLSTGPPIVETLAKTEEIILDLTRPVPMLVFIHRGRRRPRS